MKNRFYYTQCCCLLTFMLTFCGILAIPNAHAEPVHGIAMNGEPALPADYTHMPYVNPNAPKGGKIVYGVKGTFDSVNSFIVKSNQTSARGSWDEVFGNLVFESLLFRSRDEPFTMYSLLAEKVEWPEDRKWIEFTIDPRAKWADGVPVTVEDVIFTFELLAKKGKPPYSSRLKKVERMEKTGERKVKFTFNELADREYPMIIALNPILPKHATDVENFDKSTLKPMLGSGPYSMGKIDPGKHIIFKRNHDYWAKDHPSRIGFSNYDEVKVEYYRSLTSLFEAFKKGLVDVYPEGSPSAWKRNFDFPAVKSGDVQKDVFKTDGAPSHMQSFVFNTRKTVFKDKRVRKALSMLFDFEWINRTLFVNSYKRTASFWHGSVLSSYQRPASPAERELLSAFPDAVESDVMEGTYKPTISNGSGFDRKVLREALNLLLEAGFTRDGTILRSSSGHPFVFEIMTKDAGQENLAISYRRTLEKLGIEVKIRTVDASQYQRRRQEFDYDMIIRTYSASLSPGIEQIWRWGSRSRDVEGTYNFAGTSDPAIDSLIDAMLQARDQDAFIAAVRAYDRVLLSGHYVVPLYHTDERWVARRHYIKHPDKTPLYGYRLETWWDERAKSN